MEENPQRNKLDSKEKSEQINRTARLGSTGPGWLNNLYTVLIILSAPALAVFLVIFVFQSYQVDGPSMEPTLQNNDRLIVWKLPETWSKITGHAYIPNRGDIIIFHEPALGGKQLIKRVLGLPGDRVVVKDNTVTIYNLAHPNGFDPDTTLPYGKVLNNVPTSGEEDITVQAGQVFVFGDNRPNSLDSRVFGVVNSKDIIGKLAIRVVPLNKAKSF